MAELNKNTVEAATITVSGQSGRIVKQESFKGGVRMVIDVPTLAPASASGVTSISVAGFTGTVVYREAFRGGSRFTVDIAGITRVSNTPVEVKSTLSLTDTYPDIDRTAKTDVTARIQAAMNTAVTFGAELYIGPGEYLVTGLTVPNGLVMRGASPSGHGISVTGETRISLKSGSNTHMFLGKIGVAHVRLSNLHLDGNKNNNTSGDIIHLDDAVTAQEAQWHIRDCFIDAAAGYGILVGSGRRAVQISDCTINYSKLSGIRMNGSDGHIDRCILGSNLEHGIGIGGTVCNVNDCDIYGNGTSANTNTGDAISIFSTITMVNIRGNRMDQNKRHGVLISASAAGISVAGNMFHGNSQHGNGNHHDIQVTSTTGAITVSNNVFAVDGNVANKAGYGINFAAGATALGDGNVMQASSTVNGLTNTTRSLQQTRQVSKADAWAPAAAKVQNTDRADSPVGTNGSTTPLTSGRMQVVGGFIVPGGVKVVSATFFAGGGLTASLTNCWAVLINANDNTIISKSPDLGSAAWAQFASRTFTFDSSFLPWVDCPVAVGLVVVGSTMPTLRLVNANASTNGLLPMIAATANTGLTDPASLTTLGSYTAADMLPYGYLS